MLGWTHKEEILVIHECLETMPLLPIILCPTNQCLEGEAKCLPESFFLIFWKHEPSPSSSSLQLWLQIWLLLVVGVGFWEDTIMEHFFFLVGFTTKQISSSCFATFFFFLSTKSRIWHCSANRGTVALQSMPQRVRVWCVEFKDQNFPQPRAWIIGPISQPNQDQRRELSICHWTTEKAFGKLISNHLLIFINIKVRIQN